MASQQAFQAYPQNKGTLVPGQTIAVNNYTVQVERYLSQGGFAHVYLVRTPTPVYNTTHHVLKRIAVANESMLTEVKREVDVMRLLKGHPNIVHLIDAAWHKLPNGTYEVFILMEFCPGGGIIDMMNRRLRERLTEAEILQIFVDVCEGVAYMHNSRPPLLHRDLKVENILQSSPTSFKLCDFGSATTVSSTPTNMQEIRAVEADLNRHTTLQYRAPEMVDVYSKRPINEKSDVWALGVLLYKLCYYTTPFEEHGPLAILNVQYRIPPYPVYSQEMNMLIASMLREHGAQRPSVFELLTQVHRLRGSKSKYIYNVPVPQPLVSRTVQPLKPANPLEGLVTFNKPPAQAAMSLYGPGSIANTTIPNQGVQARDKVLEAIAPMRRGRPAQSKESTSRQSSPHKSRQEQTTKEPVKSWHDGGFGAEQDKAWQAAADKVHAPATNKDDAWQILNKPSTVKQEKGRDTGFGDDFAEKLWNSSDPNTTSLMQARRSPQPPTTTTKTIETSITPTPLAFTGSRMLRPKQDRLNQNRDAFDGLGLTGSSVKAAPTLGEARKLRTGLATTSNINAPSQGDYLRSPVDKPGSVSPRPSASPRLNYLSATSQQPQSISPVPTPGSTSSSWKQPPAHLSSSPGLPSSSNTEGLPIESRFPSLEELDAGFIPSANSLYPSSVNDTKSTQSSKPIDPRTSHFSSRTSHIGTSGTGGNLLRPNAISNVSYSLDGVRSQQVTGVAMRDSKESRRPENIDVEPTQSALDRPSGSQTALFSSPTPQRRPSLVRKHRSSVTMKSNANGMDSTPVDKMPDHSNGLSVPKLPPRPASNAPPQDWLTGEDHEEQLRTTYTPSNVPILRDSPSKRASFTPHSDFGISSGSQVQHGFNVGQLVEEPQSADLSPTVSRFKHAFPDIEKLDKQRDVQGGSGISNDWTFVNKGPAEPDSSSGEEGPEEASAPKAATRKTHAPKGRQSSVHELVNQWGGSGLGPAAKEKEKEPERLPPSQMSRIGDYIPRRSQMTGSSSLVPPPSRQNTDRKTPSPTSNTIASSAVNATKSSSHRPTALHQPKPQTPLASSKSPTSPGGRSRPQSMFVFPSKSNSTDSSTVPASAAPNLLPPPEEPKYRASRRTSISDMVQKYEAIGGKAGPALPAGPPSPTRPISAKGGTSMDSGRKPFPDTTKPSGNDGLGRLRGSSPSKARPTTGDSLNQIGLGSPTFARDRNRIVSDNQKPVRGMADNNLRVRKQSIKAEPLSSARSLTNSQPESTSSSNGAQTRSSPRKRTLSIPQNSTPTTAKAEEPRSPAEDRPYRGVGKLIDQWQKKSAEAEQSRPAGPAKRSFTPKRIGTIDG